eukprot:gene3571-7102_t
MDFIDTQKNQYPELAVFYDNFGDLYNKKLWHQLTLALDDFLRNKQNHVGDNLYELYTGFISKFEVRLSQVGFAQIVSMIGLSFAEPSRSIDFFTSILLNRVRLGVEASLCLDMDIVLMKLRLGVIDEAKVLLEDAKELLPKISSSESIVFSKFYKATAEYRKVIGPPQEFYRAALMYLAYTQYDSLPLDERYILATDMALAAISGDDVYNFGEVISTPILGSLKQTPNEWLFELVIALNHGDIDNFNLIIETHRNEYFEQICLSSRHEFIKQKVILLCLMNIVFERHSHDRSIAFHDIANKTRIPLDQVEWVLMRAMALGLIKGTIDEVISEVNVTWVQPRILDNGQLVLLSAQLDSWTEKVKQALLTVEDHTPELYV